MKSIDRADAEENWLIKTNTVYTGVKTLINTAGHLNSIHNATLDSNVRWMVGIAGAGSCSKVPSQGDLMVTQAGWKGAYFW